MLEMVDGGQWTAEDSTNLREHLIHLDVEYSLDEIPDTLQETRDGINTIAKTVAALKDFAVPSSQNKVISNINQLLKNTIYVFKHRWSDVAAVSTELQRDLLEIPCYPAELNQTFLAILENAIEAISAKMQQGLPGKIVCRTIGTPDGIDIFISDNGTGMSQETLAMAFEPFFTTKPGVGKGQGLTIAYDVVVNKHGGQISIESGKNQGTLIKIHL